MSAHKNGKKRARFVAQSVTNDHSPVGGTAVRSKPDRKKKKKHAAKPTSKNLMHRIDARSFSTPNKPVYLCSVLEGIGCIFTSHTNYHPLQTCFDIKIVLRNVLQNRRNTLFIKRYKTP